MRFRRAEQGAAGNEPVPRSFDVVVVTDLRFPGGTSSSLADEIAAATEAGYRIGVVHLANPRLGESLPVHPALRAFLDKGRARLLLPGEPATARLGMVKHPMVFADWPGGRLPIEVDHVLVTVGQVPVDRHGVYYDPESVDRHVTEAFGHAPRWAPVSGTVRSTLSGVTLTDDDWVEVIDLDAWSPPPTTSGKPTDPVTAGGQADSRLVIGRHSRPDQRKWPASAEEIRAAYPVDGSVRVRILGGAEAAAELLGEMPEQWEVLPFGSVTAQEFLGSLDAFVYFHHPDLTEAFGRTILEAIAAGVPAVVPDHFEPLFGDACLYATPDTAIDTVRTLVADPQARQRHVDRARALAEQRFGHAAHVARLQALIGPPAGATDRLAQPPQLDLAPLGHRRSIATTMVVAIEAERRDVERLLRSLDTLRRRAVGFVPVVVIAVTLPALAAELGIETVVVTNPRNWSNTDEPWETYAQRRIGQLARRYDVDNVVPGDLSSATAWMALQLAAGRTGDE